MLANTSERLGLAHARLLSLSSRRLQPISSPGQLLTADEPGQIEPVQLNAGAPTPTAISRAFRDR